MCFSPEPSGPLRPSVLMLCCEKSLFSEFSGAADGWTTFGNAAEPPVDPGSLQDPLKILWSSTDLQFGPVCPSGGQAAPEGCVTSDRCENLTHLEVFVELMLSLTVSSGHVTTSQFGTLMTKLSYLLTSSVANTGAPLLCSSLVSLRFKH